MSYPACANYFLFSSLVAFIPNVDQPDAGDIERKEKGRCGFPP